MRKRGRTLFRKERHDWREGNHFRLLENGNHFFPAMREAICSARHYILFEMYLFESGETAEEFIEVLCNAAERGVPVCLLLDDFGAMGLAATDRQRLTDRGVKILYFNPLRYGKWRTNLHRNHRKLLLVDGVIAFTGGAGITDDFNSGVHPEAFWRDRMVEIKGPVLADWQASFLKLWEQCGGEAQFPFSSPPPIPGGARGRITLVRPPFKREALSSLLTSVRQSKKRVWIETAYFIPTWKVRRALKKSARQGVDVRIILPGEITDHPSIRRIGQSYYLGLLKSGVRIFEYEPRFLHAKTSLCDDWVAIGSSNLDRWSFRWNAEANQEVEDAGFADEVKKILLSDMKDCREVQYDEWLERSFWKRLMERFLQAGMLWTEYLATRRRFLSPRNRRPSS